MDFIPNLSRISPPLIKLNNWCADWLFSFFLLYELIWLIISLHFEHAVPYSSQVLRLQQGLKESLRTVWLWSLTSFEIVEGSLPSSLPISVNEAHSLKQTSIVALSSRTRCAFLAMIFSLDNAIRILLLTHNYN